MTQRRIYQDEFPYFVKFRMREGYSLFERKDYAALLSDTMFKAGELKGYDILAYQIMPDHVHVLFDSIKKWSAPTERCARGGENSFYITNPARVSAPAMGDGKYNISQFIYTLKSYFVKELRVKHEINFPILQKRFYARIVSTNKYLETIIHYLKNNPINKNLPEKYHKPPYQYFTWRLIRQLF